MSHLYELCQRLEVFLASLSPLQIAFCIILDSDFLKNRFFGCIKQRSCHYLLLQVLLALQKTGVRELLHHYLTNK